MPKATFVGAHNKSKAIAFIFLYWWHRSDNKPLTADGLAWHTGLPIKSLRSLLVHWYRFNYVKRSVTANKRPCWGYSLSSKGERFIRYIPEDKYQEYVAILDDYRRSRPSLQL